MIHGTLVEKAVGYSESVLAIFLAGFLNAFVIPRNLGLVSGEEGMMRLYVGRIRIPDVAIASWDRFPDRRWPKAPIPNLVPDLAVEVLSLSHTDAETAMKRTDLFSSGTKLVWEIDPRTRTEQVYTDPDTFVELTEADTLTGDPVLPGFTLVLRDFFPELDRRG